MLVDGKAPPPPSCLPPSPPPRLVSPDRATISQRRVERAAAMRLSRPPLPHRIGQRGSPRGRDEPGERLSPAGIGRRGIFCPRVGSYPDPAGQRPCAPAARGFPEGDRCGAARAAGDTAGAAGALSRADGRHPPESGQFRAVAAGAADQSRAPAAGIAFATGHVAHFWKSPGSVCHGPQGSSPIHWGGGPSAGWWRGSASHDPSVIRPLSCGAGRLPPPPSPLRDKRGGSETTAPYARS